MLTKYMCTNSCKDVNLKHCDHYQTVFESDFKPIMRIVLIVVNDFSLVCSEFAEIFFSSNIFVIQIKAKTSILKILVTGY